MLIKTHKNVERIENILKFEYMLNCDAPLLVIILFFFFNK